MNLSKRETEILQLAAAGLRNHEIGVHMHLSSETVKSYLRSAFAKLGARNRTHAVAMAFRRGLLQ